MSEKIVVTPRKVKRNISDHVFCFFKYFYRQSLRRLFASLGLRHQALTVEDDQRLFVKIWPFLIAVRSARGNLWKVPAADPMAPEVLAVLLGDLVLRHCHPKAEPLESR
jgi:hypothetical protein